MKEGRKPEYQEKTPGDELQKMPSTKARRFKPQARLEPAQEHWWQAKKADVLTVTPRVAQMANSICNVYLSIAARRIVYTEPSLRYAAFIEGTVSLQPSNIQASVHD